VVEENQKYMDEAREYGESVPLIIHPDGTVEEGFDGEWG
jgi:hypothetical protein